MSRLFNGVNFGYRSADVYRRFQTYLRVLVRIRSDTSTMANYAGDLTRYVLDRLFDNLTDKSY